MLTMTFSADKRIGLLPSQEVATHSTISHQINIFKFWHIKGGICHAFRHLGFQIKILLLFSFIIFCNVQVLFYVIFSLISCLCFSFPLLYLYKYVLILFIYVSLIHNVQLSLLCQGEKVTLMV
jgi:hypothetical protein